MPTIALPPGLTPRANARTPHPVQNCTWGNPGPSSVNWGEGTAHEMRINYFRARSFRLCLERMEKKCWHSAKPMPLRMRVGAKYCCDHCRYTAKNKRRNVPQWLETLEEFLLRYAPAAATGYQLALIRGRQIWWYPPRDRESIRAEGPPRKEGLFSLVPFEPPIVPMTDLYGVMLFDSQGRKLRTPAMLLAGVEMRRLRRIRVEDGDLE